MDTNISKDGPHSYALSGKIMLSAIAVLFTVVILILFLHLYIRWHVIHRASRRIRRRRRLVFAADTQTPTPCAANRCLDPSILASLPVFLASAEENYDELLECPVCLNEFSKGEKIRCLPRCSHRFHLDCIDMWFCSHSTCPLCRATVEMVAPAVDTVVVPADLEGGELCQQVEEMGSTSSSDDSNRAEGSSGEEEQISVGLESQPMKTASCRMVLIRWLLMHDPRILMREQPDLERGDGELAGVADPTR